tara:strand:- start:1492 stop:2079 length:588 start_codon:yes stop_codon:yes gene_type:complete
MLYRYNKKNLQFEKITKMHDNKTLIMVIIITFLITTLACIFSYWYGISKGLKYPTPFEKELIVLESQVDTFSRKKLIIMLQDLNVKHPHIVLAQSILETGNFKSTIFRENHNLFGMKEARQRVKTAKGTQLNHAYYDSWKESVYDYAFYQCRYLGRIDSEEEYFKALDASYAEAKHYSGTLKKIIERENLKELFK